MAELIKRSFLRMIGHPADTALSYTDSDCGRTLIGEPKWPSCQVSVVIRGYVEKIYKLLKKVSRSLYISLWMETKWLWIRLRKQQPKSRV